MHNSALIHFGQGAFVEHERIIRDLDSGSGLISVFEIRTDEDVERADGIILPGGESTAMRIIGQGSSSMLTFP